MAVFLKKSIFLIIRLLGGFGMVQNTPTGCGNDLPILLRNLTFDRKCVLLYYIINDFRSDNWNPDSGLRPGIRLGPDSEFCDLEFAWDPNSDFCDLEFEFRVAKPTSRQQFA